MRPSIKLGLVALSMSLAPLVACSSQGPVEEDAINGVEETGEVDAELSTGVPIGTTLYATANLNLRSGPSTSNKIYHVIPSGAAVVTVNRSSPSNGWYNIKHGGVEGWSYGAYLRTGGGGGGGGSASRNDAISRASAGVGFSYWWGHGRWSMNGPSSSTKGACYGSCPSCSHSGSYGADCSGYVGKIWQVPSSNSNVSQDSHPYSTANFVNDTSLWHTVSRGSVLRADALVYNSNGAGHVFLFDKGDGWGSMWAYEAKGCSYGIVHDLRTASSAYHAIRRTGY